MILMFIITFKSHAVYYNSILYVVYAKKERGVIFSSFLSILVQKLQSFLHTAGDLVQICFLGANFYCYCKSL